MQHIAIGYNYIVSCSCFSVTVTDGASWILFSVTVTDGASWILSAGQRKRQAGTLLLNYVLLTSNK